MHENAGRFVAYLYLVGVLDLAIANAGPRVHVPLKLKCPAVSASECPAKILNHGQEELRGVQVFVRLLPHLLKDLQATVIATARRRFAEADAP